MKKFWLGSFLGLAILVSSFYADKADARSIIVTTSPVFGHYHGVPWAYGYCGFAGWPVYYTAPAFYYGFSYYPFYYKPTRPPTYGAIAYSVKEKKFGYAWGEWSQNDAADLAHRACGAEDCNPVVWTQGGCAAVVKSEKAQSLNWAYAESKRRAQKLAFRGCKAHQVDDCALGAWVCSF